MKWTPPESGLSSSAPLPRPAGFEQGIATAMYATPARFGVVLTPGAGPPRPAPPRPPPPLPRAAASGVSTAGVNLLVSPPKLPAPSTSISASQKEFHVIYIHGNDYRQQRHVALGIDRPNSPARRLLMHTGDLVFFPSGVPTAKIAFARENGKVTQLTLADPNVMVTARRV